MKEKNTVDQKYQALLDKYQRTLLRASDSEIQLLTLKKDSFLKPGLQKLQELEKFWFVFFYIIFLCHLKYNYHSFIHQSIHSSIHLSINLPTCIYSSTYQSMYMYLPI